MLNFSDDYYVKMANFEAVKSILEGGYGIGAILIDSTGRIIAKGTTEQQ